MIAGIQKRPWTEADIQYLVDATAKGVKASEMAGILKRDVTAIFAKRKRLKISMKPYRKATDPDLDEIRRLHFDGRGSPEIASAIGIPLNSVAAIKRKLGLTSKNGGAWNRNRAVAAVVKPPKLLVHPQFVQAFAAEIEAIRSGIDDRRRHLRDLAVEAKRVQVEIDEALVTLRMMTELQSRIAIAKKPTNRGSIAAEARRMEAVGKLEAKIAARVVEAEPVSADEFDLEAAIEKIIEDVDA